MWIENIDIPWAVATAAEAPKDVEQLREAVLVELNSYWADRLETCRPKNGRTGCHCRKRHY